MSRRSIYISQLQIQRLQSVSASFDSTGRAGARHWTRMYIETYRFEKLAVTATPNAELRPISPHRTRPVKKMAL
jgi:hypothetical protein